MTCDNMLFLPVQEEKDSRGISIGVVITVGLVAALVFFILGILASRYWSGRRERTFNVLEVRLTYRQ